MYPYALCPQFFPQGVPPGESPPPPRRDNYPDTAGNLFLFCNKHRRILKIIYWDKNGFCLWLKRLEKDKFPWPTNSTEAAEITGEQLGFCPILSLVDTVA